MNTGPEQRRSNDVAIAVLQEHQRNTDEELGEVSTLIRQHVEGCAKIQKWVLGVLVFLAGWAVAHSPEGAKFLLKLVELL